MPKRSKRNKSDLANFRSARPDPRGPVGQLSLAGYHSYVAGLLLIILVSFAYFPALHGGMLWDDEAHVTKPELRSVAGLCRIWFDVGATQQYYPLLHSAFWVEHKLWGDNTWGYHLTNVLQHALAAWLVYLVLMRLRIPGALLAAAIFAVHPIEVESVAWISEQKNTLSAIFYLAAMRVYLGFDASRRRSYYVIALLLFALGLLTKTVTATLPAALLVIFWWQRGTLSWRRDVVPLLPMFVLGAAAGLFTAWVERNLIGASGAAFDLTLVQRALIAGRAIWFYVAKLFWPANLVFIYPRWTPNPVVWWQWLFPILALAVTGLLWAIRGHWRAPLAGWLFFVGTLFPVLGFLNVFPLIYSFVADHFQYLAGLGVIVLAASALAVAVNRLPKSNRWAGQLACAVLVLVLAALTSKQSAMYGNVVTLYRTTIQRNPECWLAYNNLGAYLAAHDHEDEAEPLFREALRLRPDYAEALLNLGSHLEKAGRGEAAIELYKRALALRPDMSSAELNWGNVLVGLKRPQEAIVHFKAASRINPKAAMPHYNLANTLRDQGNLPRAVDEYDTAIQLQPDFVQAHFNLGLVFAQSGRLPKAVEEFRNILAIDPNFFPARANLMHAYADLNRSDDAIAAAKQAITTSRAAGHPETAAQFESWLESYQSQQSKTATPPASDNEQN
jgi:protein O-mannosyl-transferase